MMKWGGRKPSSSSSRPSHASPFSWLSKFKQMRINSEPNPAKMKHKEKQNSPKHSCGNGDDGAFWRQSYVEESQEDMKLKCKDIDENLIPSSSCHGGGRNAKKDRQRESTLKLKEKDKLLNDRKVSREMEEFNREKEYENLRRRFERKAQQVLQEQLLKLEREEVEFASSKAVEKDVLLQFESPRTICTPRTHSFASSSDSKNSSLRNIIEDRVFSTKRIEKTTDDRLSQKKLSSEKQNLEQIKELKVRTNKQRQPLHVQRRKPKHSPCRVRIYSPRMVSKVETCKIKALEDMRKAKLKMKKEREEIVEETPDLDSFAVIKCSLDPKQDFRDSMIEMIIEKQIRQPEEMEELLACYLTLNADQYHDLIIKVFRKVWFDMSQYGLGIKSDMQWCYYEQQPLSS